MLLLLELASNEIGTDGHHEPFGYKGDRVCLLNLYWLDFLLEDFIAPCCRAMERKNLGQLCLKIDCSTMERQQHASDILQNIRLNEKVQNQLDNLPSFYLV